MDLTHDGVEDIVMAMFNSSVIAIDGATYQYLWNTTFPLSESYRYEVINIIKYDIYVGTTFRQYLFLFYRYMHV